jgi:large conductance mechanosensitive channel
VRPCESGRRPASLQSRRHKLLTAFVALTPGEGGSMATTAASAAGARPEPRTVGLLREFKTFLLRGNLVDLAVAFVLGVAFAAVVTAFVGDLITPLIAAIFGSHDFSALTFTINGSVFRYGHFLNAVLTFVAVAAVLFFLVVRPVNALVARARRQAPPDPTTKQCPECLSVIPVEARRCAFCTTAIAET